MATAIFNSYRGTKSALVLVKMSALQYGGTPVYVPASACPNMVKGDSIEIPDGFKLVPMKDTDGNIRTIMKDGVQVLDTDGNPIVLRTITW